MMDILVAFAGHYKDRDRARRPAYLISRIFDRFLHLETNDDD